MRFFKILLKTAIHPGSLTMEYHALLYFTIQWSMQYITCGAGTKMCLPVASFGYITCFVVFFPHQQAQAEVETLYTGERGWIG